MPHFSNAPACASAPVVLVADDDAAARELITRLLQEQGIKVEMAATGRQTMNRVHDGGLDLVLLDILMPGLDGLDCCRLIKGMTQDGFLPVVLLTAKADIDSRVIGLRIGADDYICKPFDERELLARVNNLLRFKRMHDQITENRKQLEALVIRDELTGLYNYRYLQARMTEEFKRAERYREPLACIMADIDFFKRINDRYGHDAGDEVLKAIAARLGKAVREIDVIARYGGEEFLLVLPSTSFSGAVSAADRVWRAVGSEPFVVDNTREQITISLGVAVYPSREIKSKDDLIKAADRALYQSKREGRNRICVCHHQGYLYQPNVEPQEDKS